jgi:hypothetical protein
VTIGHQERHGTVHGTVSEKSHDLGNMGICFRFSDIFQKVDGTLIRLQDYCQYGEQHFWVRWSSVSPTYDQGQIEGRGTALFVACTYRGFSENLTENNEIT